MAGLVTALQPRLAQYRNLRLHLARYRRFAVERPFVRSPADSAAVTGDVYSGPIVEAVRHFQVRHSLEADGVLGHGTLAALNVPFTARVAQIELGMERLRALPLPGQ